MLHSDYLLKCHTNDNHVTPTQPKCFLPCICVCTVHILLILKILHHTIISSRKTWSMVLLRHAWEGPVYCRIHRQCSRKCWLENLELLSLDDMFPGRYLGKTDGGIMLTLLSNWQLNYSGSRLKSNQAWILHKLYKCSPS